MPSVDVTGILKHLGILKGEVVEGPSSGESATEAFLLLMRDGNACEGFVAELFPDGICSDQTFFEPLGELHRHFAYTPRGDEGIGLVWSQAVHILPAEDRQSLLRSFVDRAGRQECELLGSLWVVMRDHAFSATFLSEWVTDLVRAVEQGPLPDGVWKAIRTLCTCHGETALNVLRLLLVRPDNPRLSIAGFMLGVLRACALTGPHDCALAEVEAFLNDHADARFRGAVVWSWATTARERGLTQEELAALFARAGRSTDDRSTVVCVACQLLLGEPDIRGDTARRCRQWIDAQASPSLSSDTKHAVVSAAQAILRSIGDSEDVPPDACGWLLAIQPVGPDCVGTWRSIAAALCDILKKNRERFTQTFERLCESGAATLQRLLRDRQLRRLPTEMRGAGMDALVGKLCVSRDMDTRRLGLSLFDSLEMTCFPQAALTSSSMASRLLFYESQRVMLSPKAIARILVAVASSAETASERFRDEVFEELKLQAHNFSGECRTELTAQGATIPVVKTALDELATYFTDLDRAHKAGVNAMEVTGHRRAAITYRRRFSRQIAKSAESHSSLLSMMKTTRLLYGNTTSQFLGGRLGAPVALAETSFSMEMPLLDFCDPEEMAIRRLHASAAIERLLESLQNSASPEPTYE